MPQTPQVPAPALCIRLMQEQLTKTRTHLRVTLSPETTDSSVGAGVDTSSDCSIYDVKKWNDRDESVKASRYILTQVRSECSRAPQINMVVPPKSRKMIEVFAIHFFILICYKHKVLERTQLGQSHFHLPYFRRSGYKTTAILNL